MSSPSSPPPPQDVSSILLSRPFTVSSVSFSGHSQTKESFLKQEFRDIQGKTQTMGEFIHKLHAVENRLNSYGIFKDVRLSVDAADGPNNGAIKVEMQEKERLYGLRINAMTTRTGQPELNVAGSLRNTFGVADRLDLSTTYGDADSQAFSLAFSRPRVLGNMAGSVALFNSAQNFSKLSSFSDRSRGVSCSLLGRHGELAFESAWRDVMPIARPLTEEEKAAPDAASTYPGPSIHVLDSARPSVKNSVKYSLTRDRLDNPIVPSRGSLLRLIAEVAGLGGDTKFVKVQGDAKLVVPLNSTFSLSGSLLGGLVKPFGGQRANFLSDRFFFGTPLTMRGFDASTVGPTQDADYIGGDLMAASTLALSFKLPSSSMNELGARGHLFLNGGNLISLSSPVKGVESPSHTVKSAFSALTSTMRVSAGLGFIFPMSGFRLEVNLVQPLAHAQADKTRQFQIGVGVEYA